MRKTTKILLYLIAFVPMFFGVVACSDIPPLDDWLQGKDEPTTKPEPEPEEEVVTYNSLADFSATAYTTDSLSWVINDEQVSDIADFNGLQAALESVYGEDKSISLLFPYLNNIPNAVSHTTGALANSLALDTINLLNATSIGDYAFIDCDSLLMAELPSAKTIGTSAFYSCTELASVLIPSATTVKERAFGECVKLDSIVWATESEVKIVLVETNAFENLATSDIVLNVGSSNVEFVSGDTLTVGDFRAVFKQILIDGVEQIMYNSLSEFSETSYPADIDTWVIKDSEPSDVAEFDGLQAALAAAKIEGREIRLEFPNLVSIPSSSSAMDGALFNCTALVSISMPKATSLGRYALNGCSGLTDVDCEQIETLSKSVFSGCNSLTSIAFPNATTVEGYAFSGCSGLTAISLATAKDIKIASLDISAFEGVETSTIVLNLGGANSEYINGSTLTVGANSWAFKSIFMDGVEQFVKEYNLLEDFTADSYPKDIDTWVIKDREPSDVAEFDGLQAALAAAKIEGREITLEFPNLVGVPSSSSADNGALYGCTAISDVKIPNVTAIGDYAFNYCTLLADIETPQVESIGNYAFRNCNSLESIYFPVATTMKDSAFEECSALVSADFPMLATIGSSVFSSCTSLTESDFPEVTSIGNHAFVSCAALKSVYFPKVKYINKYVFASCKSLTSVSFPEMTTIGGSSFAGCAMLNSLDFPKVDSVNSSSFSECTSLANACFPMVTYMGGSVFSGCTSLTTLDLATAEGVKIETISDNTFDGITIADITLNIGGANSEYISGSEFIFDSDSSWIFKSIFMDGVEQVVNNYSHLSDFSETDYPIDSDTWVIVDSETNGVADFDGLQDALKNIFTTNVTRKISLEFPNLKSMPATSSYLLGALSQCRSLVGVKLGAANEIGDYAFYGCYALKSVDAPESTSVGSSAFNSCNDLTEIDIPKLVTIGDRAFSHCHGDIVLDLPNVTTIGEWAFQNCSGLVSANIPRVTMMDEYIFSSCVAMKSLNAPLVTVIGDSALSGCVVLEGVDLPLVTTIGKGAFRDCAAITELDFPQVTSIDNYGFSGCAGIIKLTLATDAGVKINSFGTNIFENVTTTNIELTLGASNSEYVNVNTITVSGSSAEFKEIILVD